MDGNFILNELVKEDSKIITEIYNKNFPLVKKFILQNKGEYRRCRRYISKKSDTDHHSLQKRKIYD